MTTEFDRIGQMLGGEQASVEEPGAWLAERGITLYARQLEILEAALDVPRTVVTSANGTGKSFLVSALAAWHVARYGEKGKVVLVAPAFKQLRTNLLPHIASILVGEPGIKMQREMVRVGEHVALQSVAMDSHTVTSTGLGAHAPHLLVILEETSGITAPMFRQIFTYATGKNSHIFAIGNPMAGSLAETWVNNPNWRAITLSAFDCPAFYSREMQLKDPEGYKLRSLLTGPEFVEGVKSDYGEESEEYHSSVLGQFVSSQSQYFSPTAIAAAFEAYRHYVHSYVLERPTLGWDVAGAGADHNEVWASYPVRNPDRIRWVIRQVTTAGIRSSTVPEGTAAMVANLANELRAIRIRVDSFGPGSEGGAELRRLWDGQVDMVNVGKPAANDVKYKNKRAEIAATLRFRLRSGTVAIEPVDRLRQEFLAHERVPPENMRERLEDKRFVKQRLGASPDNYDAIALTITSEAQPNKISTF